MNTYRNPMEFPGDEDGDILWALHLAGNDLTIPRDVNFSVLFDADDSAEAHAAEMSEAAFGVQVDDCMESYGIPAWEVVTTVYIIPSHERITALGVLIFGMAANHGGVPNGWATDLS